MKLDPSESRHGISILRLALTLLAAALLPLLLYAAAPGWWSERGVLVSGATANDYAPANQGQLKNIARAGVTEMDARLPGGAGDALHNLVQTWSSPTEQTDNFAPVNLGQLKNVAKPFYDRMIAAGVINTYPWSGSSNPPDDFAVANIGQVKKLFSFDFSGLVVDSDGNDLPDAWEQRFFGQLGVDPDDDPDGDGATNLREYQRDTDPNHYDAASSLVPSPDQLTVVMSPGERRTAPLTLSNASSGPLTFQLTPRDNTFYALNFSDSDQPSGPVYEWEDISTTGTLLPSVSNADDGFESFDLDFALPYFDQSFSSVFVSSNGFITFGEGSDQYDNYALPGTDMPANEIAAFHTDLNPGASGDIYYLNEADRTIIQYENVARYNGSGNVTFQIVLKNDGAIEIRYKDLPAMVNDVTVGLQNALRDQGLTIAYAEDYVHPNLAVRISQNVEWFRVAPASGTLAESETEQATVTFEARGLGGGTYSGTLQVTWTAGGSFLIPVTLLVDNAPSIVAITTPGEGFNQWENKSIAFTATATDPDTQIVRVEFYERETLLGTGTSSGGNEFAFTWSAVPVGPHFVTARAIDQFSQASNSPPVTVIGKPDLDADGDDLTGSEEEEAGTDPNAVDTDGDGLTDGEEVNQLGTNPLSRDSNDNGVEDGNEDTDGDGLSNTTELRTYHTDPNRWDSDYDGSSDGDEVAAASDPADASSYPPRIREVSRGLGYYYTDSGWNEQLYGRLSWWASWSSALGGVEEWSGPRLPLSQLSAKLTEKVTFPSTVERSPNYGYYSAIQNTDSWVLLGIHKL